MLLGLLGGMPLPPPPPPVAMEKVVVVLVVVGLGLLAREAEAKVGRATFILPLEEEEESKAFFLSCCPPPPLLVFPPPPPLPSFFCFCCSAKMRALRRLYFSYSLRMGSLSSLVGARLCVWRKSVSYFLSRSFVSFLRSRRRESSVEGEGEEDKGEVLRRVGKEEG